MSKKRAAARKKDAEKRAAAARDVNVTVSGDKNVVTVQDMSGSAESGLKRKRPRKRDKRKRKAKRAKTVVTWIKELLAKKARKKTPLTPKVLGGLFKKEFKTNIKKYTGMRMKKFLEENGFTMDKNQTIS